MSPLAPRVAVVGAGLVGLTIAYTARRCGAEVVVLDPSPAGGATRAAAGMLAAAAETHHEEADLSRLLVASAKAYPHLVADVAALLGRRPVALGYRETPSLVVGAERADRAALADLHALTTRLGIDTRALTTREARALEPLLAPSLSGAFLAPDDHQVDPRAMAAALLDALAALGVEVLPLVADEVLHEADDPVRPVTGVRCDERVVDADAVVVANALGASTLGGLPVDLAPTLRPVHGDVLRLAPPTGRFAPPPPQHTIRGLVGGFAVYLVPRADGSLVLGATSREDGRTGVSAGGVHDLLRDAVRILPAVAEYEITEMIARPRPATPDNLPLLGVVAPGLVVATGFGRNGILLSPVAALAVARLLDLPGPGWPGLPELPDLHPYHPNRLTRPTTSPSGTRSTP